MTIFIYVLAYIGIGLLVFVVDTFVDAQWYEANIVTVGDAMIFVAFANLLWPVLFLNMLLQLVKKPFENLFNKEFKGWWWHSFKF